MSRRRFLAALATIVAINAAWIVYDRAVVRSLSRSCQLRQDAVRGRRAVEGSIRASGRFSGVLADEVEDGDWFAERAQ